jgi:hypothetical protein
MPPRTCHVHASTCLMCVSHVYASCAPHVCVSCVRVMRSSCVRVMCACHACLMRASCVRVMCARHVTHASFFMKDLIAYDVRVMRVMQVH